MTSATRNTRLPGDTSRPGGIREVAALAAPVVVQQISATAMMVVDSAMVGRLGSSELAAVGFASVWLWTLFALFIGTASGVQTFVSQNEGAGRDRECGAWAWQALYSVVPGALLLVLLVAPSADLLLGWLAPSTALRTAAGEYIAARLPGEAAFAALMVLTAFFRGVGDTRTPMAVTIFANLCNAVLDYGFIFGALGFPRMGVGGAGLATAISSVLGAVVLFALFQRRRTAARFATRPVAPDAAQIRRFLRVGVPIGGQWAIGMTSFAFFTTLVARMGDASMAASQAFVMLLCISFMQALGISVAAQTLAGRYVGAGLEAAVERSFRASLALGIGVAVFVGVLFVTIPGPLLRIFTDDTTVLALGRPLLAIGAVFQLFDAIAIIAEGSLRGVGDTRWPFAIETLFGWGVFVPLAYTLGVVFDGGLAGAWTGGMISLGCTAALLVWRFRSGAWRRIHI
ncbi:MAG: MATE family efflux transporter [Myxococcota bacterium]|jgi:MATE family multidrug resistance protein|nr:hypothetical protein [Deltaproteobacteria bacterium]MCP4240030.1 MATE family efflux transporter [bacterium]MDP6075058.1 MATE family efflux transporter [Myxococcota bacterium]MDP6243299.1 MATE family efflux transporter [Myxococcota bacterium]MDP7075614.1 MATE family efflux transporter [Myxococcota bacterium]